MNTWPDPYIATQEDTRERADATQMKRAAVIAGSSAYIMASAGPDDIPQLTQNALNKSKIRLANEERRAADIILTATQTNAGEIYYEAINIIDQAYSVESKALQSLEVFEDNRSSDYLKLNVADLVTNEERALESLGKHFDQISKKNKWGNIQPSLGSESADSNLVPTRNKNIKGPVNLLRTKYGQDWLKEKLDDPNFLDKIRLSKRGPYYWYEAMNFADGNRNLGEIRDMLAAEYGPVPLSEVLEYFQWMEKADVVSLK